MVGLLKIMGVMSCGFVLCLSLSNASQAADRMEPDPCADRKGGQPGLVKCDEETRQGIDTIKGELLRVEGENYFVKRNDGTEALLHVDGTTQIYGNIREGNSIEAKTKKTRADNLKHAIEIRQLKQ